MSMEYDFCLKRKGQKITEDNVPVLVWYSTSVSNELTSEVLPFYVEMDAEKDPEYDYYRVCTMENLKEVYDYAVENIESLDKHMVKLKEKIKNYSEMLPKAENVDIYSRIQEDLNYAQSDMEYIEEEKDKYEGIKSDFKFLIRILEDNKGKYEIVRYCG